MSQAKNPSKLFYSDDRPLHRAIIKTHKDVQLITSGNEITQALKKAKSGILLLDADYPTHSGYALCAEIKAQFGDQFKIHILSNEMSVGVDLKAAYAGVDKLIIVPENMDEIFANKNPSKNGSPA